MIILDGLYVLETNLFMLLYALIILFNFLEPFSAFYTQKSKIKSVVNIDMKQNVIVALLSLLIVFLIVFLFSYTFHLPSQENYKDIKTVFAASKGGGKPSTDYAVRYNSNNYNVEYHDAISDMQDIDSEITWVADADGNKIGLPKLKGKEHITYYDPGTYTYGASAYVPNYEDSIYLSKTFRNRAYNK